MKIGSEETQILIRGVEDIFKFPYFRDVQIHHVHFERHAEAALCECRCSPKGKFEIKGKESRRQ